MGFPGQPMGRPGMTQKFLRNVEGRWPAAKAQELVGTLWDFEKTTDLQALLGRFALS